MRPGIRGVLPACASLIACHVVSSVAWAQCAMCNTAAGSSNVGRGLSISVLFLLGLLGLLVGVFVLVVVQRANSPARRPPAPEEAVEGPA